MPVSAMLLADRLYRWHLRHATRRTLSALDHDCLADIGLAGADLHHAAAHAAAAHPQRPFAASAVRPSVARWHRVFTVSPKPA